jgi:putative ABC transport system permease protein
MQHQPPRLAKDILHRFCHISFIEEVEGDLDEQFHENTDSKGLFRARIQYWFDVMHAILLGNKQDREHSGSRISVVDALSHFFKIFFRSLRHGRTSAMINVAGLVLSLTSFIVICLYVNDELTYDDFHPDADHSYRVSHSYKRYGDGVEEREARMPGMYILELQKSIPEIQASTRYSKFGFPGFGKAVNSDKIFEEPSVFWTDTTYTDIFSIDVIKGSDPKDVLKDPAKVIISETTARKYFGDEEPIGKEIIYTRAGMEFLFMVATVMKDYPSNAHFHPAFIVSNVALDPLWKRDGSDRIASWDDSFTYSFFKASDEKALSKIGAELGKMLHEHTNETNEPLFVKLGDVHFQQGMLVTLENPGDRSYMFVSASIGVLVLIIAAINYMNLATARSIRRSKEVGLRKTLGVKRSSLINQFLGESFLLILISFVISIGVTGTFLPFFNQLTGKTFSFMSIFTGNTIIILLAVIVGLAILSGSYPAFYLSRFKPIDVLKGKVTTRGGAENFRKVLVVFQFSITMILIICAAIIHNQLSFIQVGKLASHTDEVIAIRKPNLGNSGKINQFRDLIAQNKNVEDIAIGDHLPRQEGFSFITVPFVVRSKGNQEYMWDMLNADENFAGMFELEFITGRNFSRTIATDTTSIILNESAVRALGLTPEDAIGQELKTTVDLDIPNYDYGKVIGVVKDFPYASVRFKISPLVLYGHYSGAETIYIKLSGTDFTNNIATIEKTWKAIYPWLPFQYWFMDQEFDKLYKHEMQIARLSNYFTVFTVIIACLGLFGLASFTAEQKTKEIGIRKVLGASVIQVLFQLTNRFVRLVVIACLVAMPVSLYAMDLWLEGFAYKVPMQWWIFLAAGISVLALTYITVGIESLRAAIANPVESIKHE